MEDFIYSKRCYDEDDGGQQRGLQTSYSPHENSVWHIIQNAVTRKTEKHTEFNTKKKILKRENLIFSKLTLVETMAKHSSCHTLPQYILRQSITLL
jgi:hypothetical protein